MYFNKYKDFVNEDKIQRLNNRAERKKGKAYDLEQKAKEAEAKGDTDKANKYKAKSQEKLKDANTLNTYANSLNNQKTPSSTATTNTTASATTGSSTTTSSTTGSSTTGSSTNSANNTAPSNTSTTTNSATTSNTVSNTTNNTNKPNKPIKELSDDELINIISDWNKTYSIEIKFEHDLPKTTTNNLTEYLKQVKKGKEDFVKEGLEELVDILQHPSFNGVPIEISGYTSTTYRGTKSQGDSYNQLLSQRRAESTLNAIKDIIKTKKVTIGAVLSSIGYGRQEDKLIIKNDTDINTKPIVNTKNGVLLQSVLDAIDKNAEARQEINRRVVINIKGNIRPVIIDNIKKVTDDSNNTKKEDNIEKPILPNPEDVQFNMDSYILTDESQALLEKFANDLKKWNTTQKEKITTLYISSHTMKGIEKNKEQEILQEEMLAILSTNRAYTVKRFIINKIGNDVAKDIEFFLFPTSFTMIREKKVFIQFDNTKHMQEAKDKFDVLASKYNIKSGEKGYVSTNYVKNVAMRKSIIYNLEGYSRNGISKKCIPLELWYTKLDNKYGLGFEEDFDKFKKQIQNIFDKSEYDMLPEDYIYTKL